MAIEETRLLGLVTVYGTSCWDCKRGRIRRVINECPTGTIISHTLWHLMRVTENL